MTTSSTIWLLALAVATMGATLIAGQDRLNLRIIVGSLSLVVSLLIATFSGVLAHYGFLLPADHLREDEVYEIISPPASAKFIRKDSHEIIAVDFQGHPTPPDGPFEIDFDQERNLRYILLSNKAIETQ